MVCEHLRQLDDELTARGVEVIYRDRQPWSKNCRAWTRYACVLDLASIRQRIHFASCVSDDVWEDHWTGYEQGFVCDECHDAVIGDTKPQPGRPVIK